MFDGAVENTSGITAETFLPELWKYFNELSAYRWLLFFIGIAGFLFIHHGIPYLIRKFNGDEGWVEEKDWTRPRQTNFNIVRRD